jgi:hypothetical protein
MTPIVVEPSFSAHKTCHDASEQLVRLSICKPVTHSLYLDPRVPSCILSNAEENIQFQHPVRKPCSRVTRLHEELLDEPHP